MTKPALRPAAPYFSAGPTAKRPGWNLNSLKDAALGRSHRSKIGKAKLQEVCDRHRALLGIPDDYRIGIVPASDTGAMEMSMWSMLGQRPVDVFAWEAFGRDWVVDVVDQLQIEGARTFVTSYGELPPVHEADWAHDVIFTWNGTAAGVRVPNGDWISDDREGLAICDATSAVFAVDLPWEKLDVVTWSWQKVLGGEAAHGMLVLSPRAVERLQTYIPSRPIPKIFRMAEKGKLIEGIFKGATINTPSMLAVEDVIQTLKWVEEIGGAQVMNDRSDASAKAISDWVEKTDWIDFLATDPAVRSNTGVCLVIADDWFKTLEGADQSKFANQLVALLEAEGVAFDFNAYRDAPAGLRIWCGGTVEPSDVEALLPWLDWAFAQVKTNFS